MADIKNLETQIFNTFSEREVNSFIAKCRRITEGIIQALIEHKNIEVDRKFMLGDFTLQKDLMRKLSVDININSHINYIRLYGNRASHYQDYTFSEHDVNLVKYSFTEIVLFFYKSIQKEIPKSIDKFLKNNNNQNQLDYSYNLDKDLYLKTIIAVENSDKEYPWLGLELISKILSKIIIDIDGEVKRRFYFITEKKHKHLDFNKVIPFLRKNNDISNELISKIDELQTFFRNSSSLLIKENEVPDVPNEVKISFKELTDLFFNTDTKRIDKSKKRVIPLFLDITSLIVFSISIFSGILSNKYTMFFAYPIISLFIISGIIAYYFSVIYNITYSYSPSLRNKRLFNISKIINSLSGIFGVLLFLLIGHYLLHDKQPDRPYMVFLFSTAAWSFLLQFSIFFNNNSKTFIDTLLRILSFIFIIIILLAFIIDYPNFMNG